MNFSVNNSSYGLIPGVTHGARAKSDATIAPVPAVQQAGVEYGTLSFRGGGTRLVNEQRVALDDGYRVARTFEREDGRIFTKLEELSLTDRGARRIIVQQNPSGSPTHYEEVLDRDDSGGFRRTQRFQEPGGEVATSITIDFQVTDPFILTGGSAAPSFAAYSPFAQTRGTQLDLRA